MSKYGRVNKFVLVLVCFVMVALTGSTDFEYKRQSTVVANFMLEVGICEQGFSKMIDVLIEGGSLKSNKGNIYNLSKSSLENCEVIEKGVFMLDDGNKKGVLVYLDNSDSVVYLVEVFFDKDANILSVRKTERGVIL
jgi:hypothetical protein